MDDIPLPPHGLPPARYEPAGLHCRRCDASAGYDALNTFGALCRTCYEGYRTSPPPMPAVPAEAVPSGAGKRAWAYRLKWREEQGQPLSQAQRELWRAALRGRMIGADE